jgi:hypothetical protein
MTSDADTRDDMTNDENDRGAELGCCWRLDLGEPKDMALLIASGLIWVGGPKTQLLAVDYLIAHPEAMNDRVPENIRTALANGWRPASKP